MNFRMRSAKPSPTTGSKHPPVETQQGDFSRAQWMTDVVVFPAGGISYLDQSSPTLGELALPLLERMTDVVVFPAGGISDFMADASGIVWTAAWRKCS